MRGCTRMDLGDALLKRSNPATEGPVLTGSPQDVLQGHIRRHRAWTKGARGWRNVGPGDDGGEGNTG